MKASKNNPLWVIACVLVIVALILCCVAAGPVFSGEPLSRALLVVLLGCLLGAFFCGLAGLLRRRTPPPPDNHTLSSTQFASQMNHEIRTPMNAIVGLCRMAKETDDLEKINFYLDNISLSTTHLLKLINDLLDLTTLQTGQVALQETAVNLENEIGEICRVVQPGIEAKHHHFRLELSPDLPKFARYDAGRLRQVMENLLTNAVDYTPYAGDITLSVRPLAFKNNTCQIEWRVTDNGIGFDADSLEELFAPFKSEDDPTASSGLGLPIAQLLVKALGGTLDADSTPGKGSTFFFSLWMKVVPASQAQHTNTGPLSLHAVPLDLSGKQVLVVEDSEINQLIVQNIFEGLGATVDLAANGQQALDKYLAAPARYSLILMDIQMPVMGGHEATRHIRASHMPDAATIPIIALTADVFPEDIEKAMAAGMNAHIGKPFAVEQVEETVRAVLQPNH